MVNTFLVTTHNYACKGTSKQSDTEIQTNKAMKI